jgi:hypothetical protein
MLHRLHRLRQERIERCEAAIAADGKSRGERRIRTLSQALCVHPLAVDLPDLRLGQVGASGEVEPAVAEPWHSGISDRSVLL